MSRVAETPHCVKNIALPHKSFRVAALLESGLTDQEIANQVGTTRKYVLAVRRSCREGPPPPHEPTKADRIRELIGQGYSDHAIVSLTGFLDDYVRAVRSRHNRRMGLTVPGRRPSFRLRQSWPKRPPRVPQASGQPREELHELALTLYRWRQEGRFDR